MRKRVTVWALLAISVGVGLGTAGSAEELGKGTASATSTNSTAAVAPAPAGNFGGLVMIAPPPPTTAKVNTLSFKFSEGAGRGDGIFITVKLGKKDLVLLVDTGAPGCVIDTSLANLLDPSGETATLRDSTGRPVKLPLYHMPVLMADGERLKSHAEYMATTDFTYVRELVGRHFDGVLGTDVLSHYVVRFDFRRHVMELMDPNTFVAPDERTAMALTMLNIDSLPGVEVEYAGVGKVKMVIDTGHSAYGDISEKTLAKIASKDVTTRPTYGVNAGGRFESTDVRIRRPWTLAGHRFDFVTMGMGHYDLLGTRLLGEYVVTLDYSREKVYFEDIRVEHLPHSRNVPFGVLRRDGKLLVAYTDKNAAKLGIAVGDELVKVDGKSVADRELWELSESLRDAKSAVLTLRQKGELKEITVQIEEW